MDKRAPQRIAMDVTANMVIENSYLTKLFKQASYSIQSHEWKNKVWVPCSGPENYLNEIAITLQSRFRPSFHIDLNAAQVNEYTTYFENCLIVTKCFN
jgi:hypothetical protein